MKICKLLFMIAALLLLMGIAGCASEPTPTAEPPAATYAYPPPMNDPAEVAASLTAMPDEDVAGPTEEAPTSEPTEEMATETQADNCVECHTNQQALIDTADPVEEVVSENEGEG